MAGAALGQGVGVQETVMAELINRSRAPRSLVSGPAPRIEDVKGLSIVAGAFLPLLLVAEQRPLPKAKRDACR
jgi:hypothetical protein